MVESCVFLSTSNSVWSFWTNGLNVSRCDYAFMNLLCFPFPKIITNSSFGLPNILISESRQTKSVQRTKNHFMMECSLGLRALAYVQRWQTLTSWVNGPQIGETSSVTVWIFTQWVFLLHHCMKKLEHPAWGFPQRHFIERPEDW